MAALAKWPHGIRPRGHRWSSETAALTLRLLARTRRTELPLSPLSRRNGAAPRHGLALVYPALRPLPLVARSPRKIYCPTDDTPAEQPKTLSAAERWQLLDEIAECVAEAVWLQLTDGCDVPPEDE